MEYKILSLSFHYQMYSFSTFFFNFFLLFFRSKSIKRYILNTILPGENLLPLSFSTQLSNDNFLLLKLPDFEQNLITHIFKKLVGVRLPEVMSFLNLSKALCNF